jgi:transcriptional regulator with XRE-family HTH domain
MTQEELAEAAGTSVHSISKIERGLHSPGLETFVLLIRALGIDPARLIDPGPNDRTLPIGRLELEAQWASASRELDDHTIRVILEILRTRKRTEAGTNCRHRNGHGTSDG